jgi:hypothetical protein
MSSSALACFSSTLDRSFHIRFHLPTLFLLTPWNRWRNDGNDTACIAQPGVSSPSLYVFSRSLVVRVACIAIFHLSLNMSLTVKSLNGDTSFLLTFEPPAAPLSSPGLFPGSFTILLDREFSLRFLDCNNTRLISIETMSIWSTTYHMMMFANLLWS